MSNIGNYFESLEHCVLDGVSFGLYSSNEIKKLSVLKLTTPLSFDSLGHPIPGGLYDRVLGPATESDKCSTCGNLMGFCPGHLGYIELPVPVIHPLFYKTVLMLLKLSCRSCNYILIHENFKRLLLNQLKLLDLGLIVEAYEAENTLCSALSLVSHSKDIIAADANFVREQLENYVEKSIKESMLDKIGTYSENRNVEQLRNIFITNVLKQVPASKKCTKCKAPLIAVKKMGGQIVMSLNRVEIAPKHSEDRKAPAPRMKKIGESVLMPQKIRDNFRLLWDKEKEFLKGVFPVLTNTDLEYATDLFFLDIVTVTPPWTRPVQIRDNQIVEPPHSSTYKSIIQDCMILRNLATVVQSGNEEKLSKEAQEVISYIKGNDGLEKLHQVWQELQSNVDHLLDKDLNKNTSGLQALGIKQVLEKKEGLFRMHMMGKRVNYAARTVITPDPNIDVDEIGVPKAFALKLTYPVPVTPWNAEELRRMILNGPNVHPGACMVQNEDGSVSKLKPDDIRQRSGVAKRLLTPSDKGSSNALKVVYRHLCNGDIMLLNRQPTLHRPSIMAHRARVLTTEKTFRLHYANCKSYNADFDGDEMNAHFPQNEISRSEGYNLASVGNHYLVPKDGTPLSGLIQDHVIAGVKLSVRGRFFKRPDYQHLVFQALTQKSGYIKLLPPAIWKPEPLWSGKQVISTVIINVTPAGKSHINLTSKAKISAKDWETAKPRSLRGGSYLKWLSEMSEAHVIIRGGELLCGVLDKTHYGATPYGLVHCMYELYGGSSSLTLLSCFSKLFGAFLQLEGFTLGVKDILVRKNPDMKRKKVISKIRESGHSIALEALGLEDADEETVKNLIETEYHTDPLKWQAHLDRFYKESLDNYTNEINKICIPDGLLIRFPNNNLQLMIKSGAKGSAVNAMQISCLLGQIELEGKRPPLMKSGKALPSFAAFDTTPRAGGFVEGRFMTGIKPQEFFFHCMAGREGLIDTAVKTSRSGYLQRCLVKHLEGVSVKYDLTVRDSDGSIVQFYYGEDGMDISKSKFMNNKFFPFLVENKKVIVNSKVSSQLKNSSTMEQIREQQEKIREWSEKFQGKETLRISPFLSMNCGKKFSFSSEEKNIDRRTGRPVGLKRWIERLMQHDPNDRKRAMNKTKCPDPVNSKFRIDSVYGSISENLEDMIDSFIQKISEERRISSRRIEEIKNMIYLKSMMSISPPGEPVGLLAAQSIGEPSTQMTLNTFHFAGRGEMNVTLGIPRLREILMVASRNIKTPSMEIPFLSNTPGLKKQSENLKKKFARVTMADVLEKIHVKEFFDTNPPRSTCYDIRMDFLPRSQYKKQFSVKPSNILRAVEKRYLSSLLSSLIKASSSKAISVFFDKKKRSVATGKKKDDDDDNEEDIFEPVEELAPAPDINDNESSEDEVDADEDPESARKHGRHEETEDYDDPEEDVQREMAEELKEDVDDYDKDDEEEEIELDVSNAVDDPLEEETVNTVTEETASVRRNAVISKSTIVKNYVFDVKEELWCELSLNFPVSYKKIDLVSIIKDTAKKCIVQEVPGIKKAITYKDTANPENLMLKTDGINLLEIFSYDRILNLNKLYSNDIHAVASTYGIEAACKVIVKEIGNVFKVYGIVVDPRHLLLVADYMTRDGVFRPMSRKGLEDNISSFQKMTFESSINFLKMATVNGRMDLLQSPSSCLSLGIPVRMGTGMFDLLYQLPTEVC